MERTFSTYLNEEPYFGAKLPNGWKRVSSGLVSSPYFYTYMGTWEQMQHGHLQK